MARFFYVVTVLGWQEANHHFSQSTSVREAHQPNTTSLNVRQGTQISQTSVGIVSAFVGRRANAIVKRSTAAKLHNRLTIFKAIGVAVDK